MKVEFEKNMLIACELLSYSHLRGATEYHLDVKVSGEGTMFIIKASPTHFTEDEMNLLLKRLNVPRQGDMEQDYWGLSGESEITSELLLVGMMVDEVDVTHEDGVLTIFLKRHMKHA